MTTKSTTKSTKAKTTTKAKSRTVPAPVTGPVPPGLNDVRADGEPVVGGFVEVTKGDNKGFFGVFLEAEGDDAVIGSRADAGYRITVPLADIEPSSPNRR
jgi:hypothetical protein